MARNHVLTVRGGEMRPDPPATIIRRKWGESIRTHRRLRGMTQEQLADLIGVSARSIQDYEAGVTIPWKHLRPIAQVTRCPVEWLIHGDEAEEDPKLRQLFAEMNERVRRIEAAVLGREEPPSRQAEH